MGSLIERLDRRIAEALAAVTGIPDAAAAVKPTEDERFGDFQANGVMSLAKRLKRNPRELAREVLARLDLGDICSRVETAGPGFINLTVSSRFLSAELGALARDARLGLDAAAVRETIVVDFSCPNVAKEMHIGHIRSTIIGDAICRLLEARGHDVRRINHIGDWGTQFGMLIEYLRRTDPEAVRGGKTLAIGDLEEFYRAAKARFDADPEFAEAARREVVKLQAGDPESVAVWRVICDVSRRKFEENYVLLDVRLEEMGESFYNGFLPEIAADLAARGIARESDGALCVFLEGFGAPFMVRKRDGGYLYATTDLAALKYRVEAMGARRIIYVTDARQKEHFRQLFAAARLAGYAPEDVRLEHAAFGSILGADGAPLKTRAGRNVLLKDVIAEAVARARRVVAEKNPELPAAEQDAIARIIGVGALKYFDLRQNPSSDYVFDWDRMLALDGDTAPYLQYAYARVQSIFRKGAVREEEYAGVDPLIDARVEARLGLWLLRFGETAAAAARDCRPNIVAGYLYELAARFTAFYGECPVLKAEEPARAGRLLLCRLTARVLAAGLRLLGIEVSERM